MCGQISPCEQLDITEKRVSSTILNSLDTTKKKTFLTICDRSDAQQIKQRARRLIERSWRLLDPLDKVKSKSNATDHIVNNDFVTRE